MVRITQLPAETTPTSDDLLAMVDNAGAITKKVTIEDLASGFEPGSIDGDTLKDNSVGADKTDFGGDYSTSEVNTGFKWIDGKTIYKRTYTGTISSPANSRAVTSIMSGISTLIRYEGELYEAVGGTRLLVPSVWVNTAGGNIGAGYLLLDNTGQVNLLSIVPPARTNSPYTVTVYYTKV